MKLFNPGSELANLAIFSNILQLSRRKIEAEEQSPSSSSSSLRYQIFEQANGPAVIVFATSRAFASEELEEGSDLVSSSSPTVAKESFDLFKFLREKTDFAINRAAITLFHGHFDELSKLKDQITKEILKKNYNTPLIVTGHSLGGSVASLFTLWLLESVNFSNKKRPICVTFGSPLNGDINLQKALYKYTPWSSCFLHVVADRDPVPRKFVNLNVATDKVYQPFGTFLLCSESGCSCFEEPETVVKLLSITGSRNQVLGQTVDYGTIVEDLKRKALFKNTVDPEMVTIPYQVGIVTQLSAIGAVDSSLPQETLAEEIEKREMKFQLAKRTVNPDKKLNNSKIQMAKLEWYKKSSKDFGYYDSYKKKRFTRDIKIDECVKRLMNYWTDVVKEADMKPQAESETLRDRWLFAGLNYMRLVEPLHIAEYYHEKGLSDYENKGRPTHFVRLEELVAEAKGKEEIDEKKKKKFNVPIDSKKKMIDVILTEDSCFWAKVEEANLLCKLMKRERLSNEEKKAHEDKLRAFEDHLLALIDKYSVSREIFLEESSFMKWWKDYKDLHEDMGSHGKNTSKLNDFMEEKNYIKYSEGKL